MILRARRRRLRCSFCGKSAAQVARLIASAKGHICGDCVAACNQILSAVPSSFVSDWHTMNDEQLLASLAPSLATVEAVRQILQTQVDTLRQRGVSWEVIGKSLGVSRQAAWERFS